MVRRRKHNRSRRIVKKLLKRAGKNRNCGPINIDALAVDGGRRWVSFEEIVEHRLEGFVNG